MATRETPADRGSRVARHDLARIGNEFRDARLAAGLSVARVAQAVGLSKSHVSRIERGQVPDVATRHLGRIGAVLGLDVRLRAYPGGDPLRDAGQVRLGARFLTRLHQAIRARAEETLPGSGDRRAWDLWLDGWIDGAERTGLPVELETHVTDYQALLRRAHRKMHDGNVRSILLVIADTPFNRRSIAAAGILVASDFPVSPRAALASLAAGVRPSGSALIFL
jgi:transcriptional regulator with XRE-family HTH domain